MSASDVFLGFIAILFPPLAVWVKTGLCSADSLINICLCLLGLLPGLIHAWYIIAKYPDEHETRTYYMVAEGDEEAGRQAPQQPIQPRQQQQQQHQGYGATGSSSQGQQGAAAPPSYSDAVKGDYKVQTHE